MMQLKYIKIIVLLCIMQIAAQLHAQQFKMGNKELVFELPNPLWHEAKVDSNPRISMHRTVFKREAIEAANRRLIIPNLEIVIEKTKLNVESFSLLKQQAIKIKIDSFLYLKNGVVHLTNAKAYFGHYYSNNINYKMCIIHYVYNGYGLQVVMDCTSDIFDEVWVEFRYFVESLKLE